MKDKIIIFSIAGLIIFLLGIIAHLRYFQTKDNVIKLYSQKQTTLALQAAISLESYIKERIKAIEILAEMPTSIKSNQELYLREFKQTYDVVQGFQHIFYVNRNAVAIFGYPEGYTCLIDQPEEIQIKFKKTFDQAVELKKTLAFERNVFVNGKVTVCLITPVYSDDKNLNGAIIGSLDVRKALYDALQPIIIDSGYNAWVINELGYLIFHPAHEEMLIQNLFKANKECFNCHIEFNMEKEMLSSQSGVGIKDNLKLPKQLVGYAQVHLENTKWVVAISTPFETITTSLRSEFRNFLFLIIAIIVTIVFGAFLVNRINSKHISTKKELENLKIQAALINEKNVAESRYRILVEQSPDPIFLSTENKIIMVNKSFEDLFGYSLNEVSQADLAFLELIDAEKEKFQKEVELIIEGKKKISSIPLKMRNKSGKTLEVEVSLSQYPLKEKIGFQGVIHDVTKVKQLEREREQKKNLAIIGEMATRIAHEIKNPLASIQTGIQLLESQVTGNGKQKSYYERLQGEIQRVDAILKSLLSYAREDQLNAKIVSIKPVIKRFEELLTPTLEKQNLKLEVELEENLPQVYIDEQKMEQVLWNICLNAIQASENKGQIFLSIQRHKDGIKLKIQDRGIGIAQEYLDKIFQPFFSTRPHGSGLGLAISKKIIEMHKGQLTVVSNLNEGTTVTIFIPGKIK